MKPAILGLGLASLLVTASAAAAPPWVDRPITLPRHVFAGDVGFGIAHFGVPAPAKDVNGFGVNLEGAFAVTDRIELGLRTGIRAGDDGRFTRADTYGRTLWTETYGTGTDALANPELKFRWAAYSGRTVEVGLDARLVLPVETGTEPGLLFGVPFAFHVGIARIDVGPYVGTFFYNPTAFVVTVPAYFWFQASDKFWLGPMLALRHFEQGDRVIRVNENDFLLGGGFGYQVADAVDLKWMFFWPRLNQDRGSSEFGAGFGVQFRVE